MSWIEDANSADAPVVLDVHDAPPRSAGPTYDELIHRTLSDETALETVATDAARKFGWGYVIRKDQLSDGEIHALIVEGFAEDHGAFVTLTDAGIRAALDRLDARDYSDNA